MTNRLFDRCVLKAGIFVMSTHCQALRRLSSKTVADSQAFTCSSWTPRISFLFRLLLEALELDLDLFINFFSLLSLKKKKKLELN